MVPVYGVNVSHAWIYQPASYVTSYHVFSSLHSAIAMDAISRRRNRTTKVIKQGSEIKKSKSIKQNNSKQTVNSKMLREYTKKFVVYLHTIYFIIITMYL